MKDDVIYRHAAIDALAEEYYHDVEDYRTAVSVVGNLPSAQPEPCEDAVSRRRLLSDLKELAAAWGKYPVMAEQIKGVETAIGYVETIPSVKPEQRYTEEELRVFKHGISLSLLSKRSSQHWQYDEDTATEIKFLERLYEKVSADMRGAE